MKEKTVMFNFADGPKEIKVGDTLYYPSQRSRIGIVYEIVKIGRDLITCDDSRGTKFYIQTGRSKSKYSGGQAYSSEESYYEFLKISKYIREVTDWLSRSKMTLEQAKQIASILGYEEYNDNQTLQ